MTLFNYSIDICLNIDNYLSAWMLKWAVTPRSNDEFDHDECLTFEKISEQQKFPCLVRIDNNDSLENHLILLCETNEPYLSVSNETKQFAIPILFDGLLFFPYQFVMQNLSIFRSLRSSRTRCNSLQCSPVDSFFITTFKTFIHTFYNFEIIYRTS